MTSIIKLEDDKTVTVAALDDGYVSLTLPGCDPLIVEMTEAHQIGAALCMRSTESRDAYYEAALRASGKPRR